MSTTITHQSRNPHARKNLAGGPITTMPIQKNKGAAKRRRTMTNRGQGTRPAGPIKIPKKMPGGFYPHSDGLAY